MDKHNDGLVVYAKKDGDKITLSDDGFLNHELLTESEKQHSMLVATLTTYGIKVANDNELTMEANIANFPFRLHMFIHAILEMHYRGAIR